MSHRNLYVTCPDCHVMEIAYIGMVDMDRFDINGEFITTRCEDCNEKELYK